MRQRQDGTVFAHAHEVDEVSQPETLALLHDHVTTACSAHTHQHRLDDGTIVTHAHALELEGAHQHTVNLHDDDATSLEAEWGVDGTSMLPHVHALDDGTRIIHRHACRVDGGKVCEHTHSISCGGLGRRLWSDLLASSRGSLAHARFDA